MEATRRNESARWRRAWLPWGLLAGGWMLGATGAWAGSRSVSSLVERGAQLEREAAESEARVAELQALREAMSRRLRVLEQQHQSARAEALTAAAMCSASEPPAPAIPQGKAPSKSKKGPRR